MNESAVRERAVSVNGVDLHLMEAGEGPLVVLAHGFPELAYSWRHQLPALAEAGYHAVAPDMRGYGRSSAPDATEDYDIFHLSGDLVGLIDEAGADKAVVVGHDWGAIAAWNTAIFSPERLAGVVGMSVPFLPRGPMSTVELLKLVMGDSFFYILYFQEPGVAEADLGKDAATTMRRILSGLVTAEQPTLGDNVPNDGRGFVDRLPEPESLPDWLSQEELDVYVREFTRTGFRGGVSWYRNFHRNWELTEKYAEAKVTIPSLFIVGSQDPVLAMAPPSGAEGWLEDHRGDVFVEGAGHWVQQERADEVNEALLAFLKSRPAW